MKAGVLDAIEVERSRDAVDSESERVGYSIVCRTKLLHIL